MAGAACLRRTRTWARTAITMAARTSGPGSSGPMPAAGLERRFVDEYRELFMNPYRAADVGQIDEVIEPRETRPRLVRALEVLRTKVQQNPPRKHGLMPV